MNVAELSRQVRQRGRELSAEAGEARAVVVRAKSVSAEVEQLTGTVAVLEKVTILLTSIGEQRQDKAQASIEALVTRGLQTIFDSSLSFHLVSSTARSAAQVDFIVRTTFENGSTIDTHDQC